MSTPKCKWGRDSFLVAKRRRFRRETVGWQRMSELLESRHLMTGPAESYSGIDLAAFQDLLDVHPDVAAEVSAAVAESERTSPWQNAEDPADVNADGATTPIDALLVVNQLNAGIPILLSSAPGSVFVDVNGDRQLSPIDALQVINDMNEAAVMGRLPTAANRAAAVSHDAADQLVPPDTPDGKTRINYLDEPFAGYSPGFFGMRYVKCHLLTSDPGRVYFQDSWKYPFHYDFARDHLAPFLNMTREQFDAVSLRQSGQQVVLGTVLMSPDGRELAVQLVGYDAYPREQVAAWIDSIVAAVQSDKALTVLYMPTFEQTAAAEADRSWFAERGITVADPSRWVSGNVIYAEGWATGRLVRVPADQISAAYGDGRLRPTDILLLTDGVPAEVPFVRGIISLVPATPNSHVAILARNQRIPFVWLHNAQQQEHLAALDGKSLLLRASQWSVNVSALDDPLEPSSIAEWLAEMQSPKRAQVTPRETYGKWLEDVTGLTPDSIRFFGGKASHYGLLRRTIPDNSQPAVAFSFDVWEAILSNVNPQTGLTLRQEIESRLGSFSYPPDMTLARAKLAEVNTLIRKTVRWTDAQKSRILSELAAAFPELPPDAKLRFRSSSNAEDSQELTGAGLYDSFSGCIADDTDGDNQGPSLCDPDEPEERGVLRAIEKVFASFYNENAWLERLRHQVLEQDTGMAVLVHQNFPDEDEMANGVVTLKYRKQRVDDPGWGDPGGVTPGQPIAIARAAERWEVSYEADIVTQLGAVSVTNPTGGTTAERVGAFFAPGQTPYVYVRSASSLVPIGGTVMTWDRDYTELCGLIERVAEGYAQLFPDKTEFTLDLEFKRMEPGTLIIKQVREIPAAPPQMVPPRLLNERTELQVLQSEFTDVWSHHRLKSTLSLSTRNGSLSGTETPLTRLNLTMLNGSGPGAKPVTLSDGPAAWPDFSYSADTGQFSNGFTQGSGNLARNLKLLTSYPSEVDARLSPVITSRDFTQELEVTYASPVPWLEGTTPATRTSDRVMFIPSQELTPDTEINTRSFTFGNLQITTRFKWWKPGDDNLFVKTLPVAEWVDTVITGLTTEPITLTNSFAQSYGPGHHNFWEEFIFEPALDPSVTATQRAELAAVNVRLLHVYHNRIDGWLSETSTDRLTILGLDGVFQRASDVTLPDVNLRVGRQRVLGATGVDADGNSYTFAQPVWQIQGGGTLTQNGSTWSVTATRPGRWELTCTDAARPGSTGHATLWVAGVVLDGNGTLQIIGTGGDDRISVSQQGGDKLRVEASFLNGPQRMRQFRLADVQRIEVHGRPGDDRLQTTRVNVPMWVDGGDGHDRLQGGHGDDVILGGQGRDLIWGGMGADILLGGEGIDGLWGEDGHNLLIGGAGADLLCGGIGEDILAGGMTLFSEPSGAEAVNVDALRAILNEWGSPRSRSVRRANLRDGSGSDERLNEDYFLQLGSTVLDDNQLDVLVGRSRHWRLPS